jgi:predicted TPR repeat methyltransferase
LDPRPGERILDLGCGDGVLTKKIADIGCDVVAVDSSAAFIDSARKLGLVAHVVDAVARPITGNSMLFSAMPCCIGSSGPTEAKASANRPSSPTF